jgi:hypothetical protein
LCQTEGVQSDLYADTHDGVSLTRVGLFKGLSPGSSKGRAYKFEGLSQAFRLRDEGLSFNPGDLTEFGGDEGGGKEREDDDRKGIHGGR